LGLAATAPAPSAFRLRGPLNVPALRQALEHVVARHEILRTVFREEDGVARQIVRPIEDVVLPFVIVNADAEGDDLAPDAIADAVAACARDVVAAPMRLDEGPLFRLAMIRVAVDHHVLVCSMHHIITDGVSLQVFTSDLAAAYAAVHEGRAPAWVPLPVQFRDIVHWQEAVLDTPAAAMMTESLEWRAATTAHLARANRCTCSRGDSLGSTASSILAASTVWARPSRSSNSRRRGERDASTRAGAEDFILHSMW
ncbi:MAG: hypothetical protein EBW96_07235, partial [Actinobacteria bacterium]|nr:hypothetical protein [Actinomycetota bacterium]